MVPKSKKTLSLMIRPGSNLEASAALAAGALMVFRADTPTKASTAVSTKPMKRFALRAIKE
jgi:hypothetical protein